MSKQIRSLAYRLNRSVTALLSQKRLKAELPVVVSLANKRQIAGFNTSPQNAVIEGLTQDLSQSDISFVVPVIRINEHYLAGHEEELHVEMGLPNGNTIKMKVTAARYEQIRLNDAVSDYLINAQIREISEKDQNLYEDLLKNADSFFIASNSKPNAARQTLASQFFSLF